MLFFVIALGLCASLSFATATLAQEIPAPLPSPSQDATAVDPEPAPAPEPAPELVATRPEPAVMPADPLQSGRTLGEWQWTAAGGLRLVKAHERSNAFWAPDGKIGPDGVIRATFALGKRPDSSFFYRAHFPEDISAVDGYSLSFDHSSVLIHRWEGGYAFPIMGTVKLKKKPARVDVTIEMHGDKVDITIADSEKHTELAKLHAEDLAYYGDETGYRAYKKQDGTTGLVHYEYEPDESAKPHRVNAHPEAYNRTLQRIYVAAPKGRAKELPGLKKCATVKDAGIKGFEIYRCGNETMMSLVDADRMLPEGFFWFGNRWSMNDSEYRAAAKDLDCKTPMRCKKGERLDPNRSAKDADMIVAYTDAYADVCRKHVKHVRVETIGSSYLGFEMRAIVLTNAKTEKVPRVAFLGAHHGLELLATDMAFDVLEELCESEDEEMRKKYDAALARTEVWVVPVVNYDGTDLFFHASNSLGRKNGRNVFTSRERSDGYMTKPGSADSKSAFYYYHPNTTRVGEGVDINRNYPLQWGATGEKSSSGRPRDYWYRGTAPASEPEIQTMMNLFFTEQFASSISFHTVSTKILSPYSIDALQNPPHEKDNPWQVALRMAEAAGTQANGRSYQVVKNLYSVDGTDQDWFRMMSGTYAYLIEGALHNPTGAKRRTALERNRPAWQTLLFASRQATRVTVHDAEGKPLLAEVRYSDESSANGEHWLTRCADGSHTMLCQGPREITVTLMDGTSQKKKVKCNSDTVTSVDFTFERPADYDESAIIANANYALMGVDAICDLREHTCPHLPANRYCLIDDACVTAGTRGDDGGVCDPIENNRGWSPAR